MGTWHRTNEQLTFLLLCRTYAFVFIVNNGNILSVVQIKGNICTESTMKRNFLCLFKYIFTLNNFTITFIFLTLSVLSVMLVQITLKNSFAIKDLSRAILVNCTVMLFSLVYCLIVALFVSWSRKTKSSLSKVYTVLLLSPFLPAFYYFCLDWRNYHENIFEIYHKSHNWGPALYLLPSTYLQSLKVWVYCQKPE